MKILSLGAGVQSTTLLLMAVRGEIERPDHAIFADTQDEPAAVYRHLETLKVAAEGAGIGFHTVTAGKLSSSVLRISKRTVSIPSYGDRGGMSRRQCTREFKVAPITKKVRELVGARPYQRLAVGVAEMWIGISLDEVQRMKMNRDRWITNRWPLIEKRMTRHDCLRWLKANGYGEPEKSACVYCPYHDNATWRRMKMAGSAEWAEAVRVDRELNERGEYLHRSLKSLDQVDFSNDTDRGQTTFDAECEGMCGV